jgi:hypothetical protein
LNDRAARGDAQIFIQLAQTSEHGRGLRRSQNSPIEIERQGAKQTPNVLLELTHLYNSRERKGREESRRARPARKWNGELLRALKAKLEIENRQDNDVVLPIFPADR